MKFVHAVAYRFLFRSGGFRDVFLTRIGDERIHENIVFKQYHFDSNYVHEDFEYMRIDSLVSEIFTSSPLFLDIYRYVSRIANNLPRHSLRCLIINLCM